MSRLKYAKILITSLLILLPIITFSKAGDYLFGVLFYVSKGGPEVIEFRKGDTVFLKAIPPIGGRTLNIEVQLVFPPESGKTPITLVSRTTMPLVGEQTITTYTIQQADWEGTYAMRITAWDPGTGERKELDLSFKVVGVGIPWELIIALAVVLVAIIIAVVIYQRGKAPTPPPVPRGPAPPGLPEGTQVIPRGGGTIMIRGPSGETRVVTAMLQAGARTIPISTLPQTFGREDFTGIVSDDLLRTISRREGPGARGQFTIGYDYARGTFLIWDDGSTNGTYLNGEDIRGKGRLPLKNGDIISPANALNIKFISGPA
ncbi:MAG: FHA domain-containing protein [Nitrososphaerota archaeon]